MRLVAAGCGTACEARVSARAIYLLFAFAVRPACKRPVRALCRIYDFQAEVHHARNSMRTRARSLCVPTDSAGGKYTNVSAYTSPEGHCVAGTTVRAARSSQVPSGHLLHESPHLCFAHSFSLTHSGLFLSLSLSLSLSLCVCSLCVLSLSFSLSRALALPPTHIHQATFFIDATLADCRRHSSDGESYCDGRGGCTTVSVTLDGQCHATGTCAQIWSAKVGCCVCFTDTAYCVREARVSVPAYFCANAMYVQC